MLVDIAIERVTQQGGWGVDKDSCKKDVILIFWLTGLMVTKRLTIHKLCLHYRLQGLKTLEQPCYKLLQLMVH